MIAGLSGSLLSHDALEQVVRHPRQGLELAPHGSPGAPLRVWHADIRSRLGPSSGPRRVFDLLAEPLARALGFGVVPLSGTETVDALLQAGDTPAAAMIATSWGQAQGGMWRHAVHRGLALGVRWSLCLNGPSVRVVDVDRVHARRYARVRSHAGARARRDVCRLLGLLHAAALAPGRDGVLLERIVALCERHRAEVRVSLREGVQDALLNLVGGFRAVTRKRPDAQLLDESLIVVYRILFLLFAEARGLVPHWHPDLSRQLHDRGAAPAGRATVAAASACGRRCRRSRGSRIAAAAPARCACRRSTAGCSRRPTRRSPTASRSTIGPCGRRVLALDHPDRQAEGRERIAYGDLGVEQLGGVYERLLDFDLAATRGARRRQRWCRTGRRKATGSFYTPRSLTEYLVRRTLAPLVHEADARSRSWRCACSIRRWAAARSSSPRAAISPPPTSTR